MDSALRSFELNPPNSSKTLEYNVHRHANALCYIITCHKRTHTHTHRNKCILYIYIQYVYMRVPVFIYIHIVFRREGDGEGRHVLKKKACFALSALNHPVC